MGRALAVVATIVGFVAVLSGCGSGGHERQPDQVLVGQRAAPSSATLIETPEDVSVVVPRLLA